MGTRKKNLNAAALGSLGGKARAKSMSREELSQAMSKAAKTRMKKLTEEERKRLARRAANVRWAKPGKDSAQ
jgi:uncharacterized membrane protein